MSALELTTATDETLNAESAPATCVRLEGRIATETTTIDARLRYALLLVILIAGGWLAFTVYDLIRDIEAEVNSIQASIVRPVQ